MAPDGTQQDTGRPRRLWRLRKLHQSADAIVRPLDDGARAELQLHYNGVLSVVRVCPTMAAACEEAAARRADLERDGWTFHW